jgi:hypothetical protein
MTIFKKLKNPVIAITQITTVDSWIPLSVKLGRKAIHELISKVKSKNKNSNRNIIENTS